MPRALSFASLRLSILAAAGLSAACSSNPAKPNGTGGHGGSSTTTSTATGGGTTGTGGAATGTGGAAGSGGAGGGGVVDPVCAGAKAIPANNGADSGFAKCPDGSIHRVKPAACDPTIDAPACSGTEMNVTCETDADCTAAPHGRCVSTAVVEDTGVLTYCGCQYSCVDDTECGAGQVCVCGGVLLLDNSWSYCANAACTTGADCASGDCAISDYYNGCVGDIEIACRAPEDVCRTDADCASDGGQHRYCVMSEGSWQCLGWTCVLGRPLVVAGETRTAPPAVRADWQATVAPDLTGLDAETRAARAAYWSAAAAMEHASVASFARFTLELLALGAPAALVAEAQRAGLDEVEHARVAYTLASAYAGHDVGPGPLDLGAVRIASDPVEAMCALIDEACVGETLGAAEALAYAESEPDPAVAAIHRRIAADEQRHAELAWRTLTWLLDGAGEDARRIAAERFEAAIAAAGRDPGPGLLDARALAAVRRQALREVVAPCAAALLGHTEERADVTSLPLA